MQAAGFVSKEVPQWRRDPVLRNPYRQVSGVKSERTSPGPHRVFSIRRLFASVFFQCATKPTRCFFCVVLGTSVAVFFFGLYKYKGNLPSPHFSLPPRVLILRSPFIFSPPHALPTSSATFKNHTAVLSRHLPSFLSNPTTPANLFHIHHHPALSLVLLPLSIFTQKTTDIFFSTRTLIPDNLHGFPLRPFILNPFFKITVSYRKSTLFTLYLPSLLRN